MVGVYEFGALAEKIEGREIPGPRLTACLNDVIQLYWI